MSQPRRRGEELNFYKRFDARESHLYSYNKYHRGRSVRQNTTTFISIDKLDNQKHHTCMQTLFYSMPVHVATTPPIVL